MNRMIFAKDDVEAHMKKEDNVEMALKKLDEQYQKYKFMEANLVQKKLRYDIMIFLVSCQLFYVWLRHAI